MTPIKTVFSMDPGTHNCAFTVIQYKEGKSRLLEAGMLLNTVLNLTHPQFKREFVPFIDDIKDIIEKYSPDLFIIERFQNRGRTGKTIESVNIMIGVVSYLMVDRRYILVVASQWKNQFNRQSNISLNDVYKIAKKEIDCPPHVVDAYLINMYGNKKSETYIDFNIKLMLKRLSRYDWKIIVKELNAFFKSRPK